MSFILYTIVFKIFSLITSYFDPPAGITVEEGKAYNPYFLGGVIAMPQQLYVCIYLVYIIIM